MEGERMDKLRYPIGMFEPVKEVTTEQRQAWIEAVASAPAELRRATEGLTTEQHDTPYRPGGWTVRQVVHHVADSSVNVYVRFKLSLTEDLPVVKPYLEDRWAELKDYHDTPIETSILLVESLHQRFVTLLRSLEPADFARAYSHPVSGHTTLDTALQHFVWHTRHHIAQITSLRERMGW
jgi:uncharacterized damage-inducible protein DinB